MKIERFQSNAPQTTNATEGTQPAVNESKSMGDRSEANSADQQSAARSHATSQKGNLDLYGVTQRLKLSSQTTALTPGGSLPIATPEDQSKTASPTGNIPIATPDNQPGDSSNKQGFTHTKRQSNIARGSGGLTAYGDGKTIGESGSSVKSGDKTFSEGEGYSIKGEAAALETRSRTFEYESGLGVGAQAEASLIRGKIGVQGTKSHMVGGVEVVGVSGHAGLDGMVGARTTAEAGVGIGKDGLPAVRVGAEAFAGARVDARNGGEARLMGVGADAVGTSTAMAGVQANTEASLSPTGMQASAYLNHKGTENTKVQNDDILTHNQNPETDSRTSI